MEEKKSAEEDEFARTCTRLSCSGNRQEFLDVTNKFLQYIKDEDLSSDAGSARIRVVVSVYFCNKLEAYLRKGILKCFLNLPQEWQCQVINEISSALKSLLLSSEAQIGEISSTLEKIIPVYNEPRLNAKIIEQNYDSIVYFYNSGLTILVTQLKTNSNKIEELEGTNVLHTFLQTLITFIDINRSVGISEDVPVSLYDTIKEISSFRKLPMGITYNCGLLLVTLDYYFFQIESSIRLATNFTEISPIMCLTVCHGFMAGIPVESMVEMKPLSDNSILQVILESTFTIYERNLTDTFVLVGVLKIAAVFAKRVSLKKYTISEKHLKTLISVIWSHLDYPVDIVKNLSKEALIYIVNGKEKFVINQLLQFLENSRKVGRKECIVVTNLSKVIPIFRITSCYKSLNEDLLNALRNNISFTYISQAYVSLMVSDFSNGDVNDWFDKWVVPILLNVNEFGILLEHVLISAAKLSSVVVHRLLLFCQNANSENYASIVKCILELKRCNTMNKSLLLTDSEVVHENAKIWKNSLPFELIQRALLTPNSDIAITTITLILESAKESETFSEEELKLFKIFINTYIAAEKSDTRQKVLSVLKKLFSRIHTYNSTNSHDLYHCFVKWTACQCIKNLFPGASYARRFTTLRILLMLTDLKLYRASNLYHQEFQILFTCLHDSFEENKQIAKSILLQLEFQKQIYTNETVADVYRTALEMAIDVKFAEHNTAAHVIELICAGYPVKTYCRQVTLNKRVISLVDKMDNNRVDKMENIYVHIHLLMDFLRSRLLKADENNLRKIPLHGLLHVIRHLLECVDIREMENNEKWCILVHDIVRHCISCNSLGAFVVSYSAPEGYMPENEVYDLEATNPYTVAQELLLCSWRTVKEASLILGIFAEKFPISELSQDKNLFLNVGNHLKSLICRIKHRGAFEQVYISLCQFCNRCGRFPDNEVNAVLNTWLNKIIEEITSNGGQLSTLRRSAGIPYIVQAILCSESSNKKHRSKLSLLNDEFMDSIFKIFDLPESAVESKVHALNILRALFRHKDIAEEMSNYVEKSVIISVNGFKSTHWNEKNSSTLLFSALLVKIFGVPRFRFEISWKNKMTGKMFFQRYPRLFDFFLGHLKENDGVTMCRQSVLFPILLVFVRLYVSEYDDWNTTFQLNALIPYLYKCSKSCVYKIRELAVSAIMPFITRDIYVEHLEVLWSHIMQPFPENTVHGLLLQFAGLVQNVPSLEETKETKLRSLLQNVLTQSNQLLNNRVHSYIVKEQLLIVLSAIVSRYYRVLELNNLNYSFCENGETSEGFLLNKKKYVVSYHAYHLGLVYCEHLKRDKIAEFAKLMETFVEHKSTEETSNILLDFILCTFEGENADTENNILSRFPPDATVTETILKSKILYEYIKGRLVNDEDGRLKDVLRIFSRYLSALETKDLPSLVDLLLSLGEKHCHNSSTMIQLITCTDVIFEKLENYDEICVRVFRLLLRTSEKPYADYQDKLRYFMFRYYHAVSPEIDTIVFLELWSFLMERVLTVQENECEFLKGLLLESEFDEDQVLAHKAVGSFVRRLETNPVMCAVGLVAWILKDVGIIFHNVEKSKVFCNDLPAYLEDQLYLCDITFTFFKTCFNSHRSILRENLDENILKWLLKKCALEEEFENVRSVDDVINAILEKSDLIRNQVSADCIFTRYNNSQHYLISRKISYLEFITMNQVVQVMEQSLILENSFSISSMVKKT